MILSKAVAVTVYTSYVSAEERTTELVQTFSHFVCMPDVLWNSCDQDHCITLAQPPEKDLSTASAKDVRVGNVLVPAWLYVTR